MLNLYFRIRNWLEREEGQDLIEYALLVVFIALVAFTGMQVIGPAIADLFTRIGNMVGTW